MWSFSYSQFNYMFCFDCAPVIVLDRAGTASHILNLITFIPIEYFNIHILSYKIIILRVRRSAPHWHIVRRFKCASLCGITSLWACAVCTVCSVHRFIECTNYCVSVDHVWNALRMRIIDRKDSKTQYYCHAVMYCVFTIAWLCIYVTKYWNSN